MCIAMCQLLKRTFPRNTYSSRLTKRRLYNATVLKADLSGLQQHTGSIRAKSSKEQQLLDIETAKQNAQIVVIGAGLAGLSAAQHLLRHGFKRTIVLEATDRFGGRINSQRFGDAYCELGAKWVKIDGSRNSMYELLKNVDGLRKQIKQKDPVKYVKSGGTQISSNMVDLIDTLFHQLCRGFKVSEKVRSGSDLQALDNVMTYFKSESDKLIGLSYQETEKQAIARDIFQSLFKEFSSTFGCCLDYVNIEHITSCSVQQEMGPIYVPTGLDSILNSLTQNIEKHQLQTGKPVGKIQWQSFNGLDASLDTYSESKCVGCLDGSLYKAHHIICTLPLGVLKNFGSILFKPMLPLDKMQAIKNLGYGNPVKIYLAYKRPINRWLKSNLRPLGTQVQHDTNTYERVWTQQVVEISQLPSSQHVLEIQVGGGNYEEIEKLPDANLVEQITALLRQCLPNCLVPYPQALLRSNWSSSACYLGGRPYLSTISSARDVQRLAAPLGDTTLLFAGDATDLHGFGTIDGARSSGIREAQRIINYYYLKKFL